MPKPRITTLFAATIKTGSVDEFAARLKTVPTSIRRKGDKRPPPRPDVPCTEWVLERKKVESYSINDELNILLDSLWPDREELITWAKTNSVAYIFRSLVYVIENEESYERPLYILHPDVMARMAYIKGQWDIAIQHIKGKTETDSVEAKDHRQTRP
jgi:hypothetical protein